MGNNVAQYTLKGQLLVTLANRIMESRVFQNIVLVTILAVGVGLRLEIYPSSVERFGPLIRMLD
jgi:hypothetical protein